MKQAALQSADNSCSTGDHVNTALSAKKRGGKNLIFISIEKKRKEYKQRKERREKQTREKENNASVIRG